MAFSSAKGWQMSDGDGWIYRGDGAVAAVVGSSWARLDEHAAHATGSPVVAGTAHGALPHRVPSST